MSKEEQEDIVDIEGTPSEELPDKGSNEPSADSLRILEALLFASDEILTSAKIKTILPDNPDARQIRKMVEKINVILQKERHPFEVVEIGGGYQFRTVAYYHPWVRQIFKEKAAKKLSIQSLECLAIIAYKQPLSKAEIEAIRGVVSDGAMKTLLEKRLVTITGRSDKPGRPLLYGTTQEFLKYFGLNKIEDMPRMEEFEAIAREKIHALSIDELQEERIPTPDDLSLINDTEIIDRSSADSLDSCDTPQDSPDAVTTTQPVETAGESNEKTDKSEPGPTENTIGTDEFIIDDDITKEEMTETSAQERDEDLEKRKAPEAETPHVQEASGKTTTDHQVEPLGNDEEAGAGSDYPDEKD